MKFLKILLLATILFFFSSCSFKNYQRSGWLAEDQNQGINENLNLDILQSGIGD
ncbi:MAG: hypothetical protein K1060chlam1_00688 [Candidatus Anoxychlamydiales bacterium]|nr:hypothetical protein [Candidatus Anoxychlamydiales bacterium]